MSNEKDKYIKLGNLTFHKDGASNMPYKQFIDTYTSVLKGYDVKKAAKLLGVKFPKKVASEEEEKK